MAVNFTAGKFSADNDAGAPLVGGLLYTYASGTTTPKATYTSATLGTANTNPIVLDARGEASVWLGVGPYTMLLKTAAGVTVYSEDGIEQFVSTLGDDLAAPGSSSGAAMVGFINSGTGAVNRTSQDKMREVISRADYETDGNYDSARAAKTGRSDMVVRPTGKTDTLLSDALVSFETRALSTDAGKGATLIGTTIAGIETVQEALDKINSAGVFDQATTPAFTVPTVITGVAGTQTASVDPYLMTKILPSAGRPVVFIKLTSTRAIVRTLVTNGGPQDYIEFEMFNWAAWMYANYPLSPKPTITHCWALHGIRAVVGGRQCIFLEQPLDDGLVSTTEFAMEMGAIADSYVPEGNPSPTYKRVGYGHGGLSDLTPSASLQVTVDGVAGNLASLAAGTVVEGCNVVFSQIHRLHLLAGSRANEVIGQVAVTHIFDTRGLTVLHNHTISASGIGVNNSYSGMMPMTGCDKIKAKSGATANLNLRDGSQVGNWAGTDRYAAWNTQTPVALLEFTLPTTAPGLPPGNFSYATSSQSFALNNTNWLSKFYINWVSGAAPIAMPSTHDHQFRITVRRGLPD